MRASRSARRSAVLMVTVLALSVQQVSAAVRQDNDMVPMTVQPLDSDESLLTKVAQVARSRIGGAVVVVAEVPCRNDPKGTDGRERTE